MAEPIEPPAPAAPPVPPPASTADLAPAEPARASRRGRRAWRWTGAAVALLAVLVLALVAAVWWVLDDARGSAWVVSRIPGVAIVNPTGSLRGTFAAERIEVPLADGGAVRILAPRWTGLSIGRGSDGRWLALRFATIDAERVHVRPGTPAAPTGEPARPPASLRAAFELQVEALSAGALVVGPDEAAAPLVRDIRGRLHVGADGGLRHRLDGASATVAALGGARVDGTLALGTDAPFETRLALVATSPRSAASAAAASSSDVSGAPAASAASAPTTSSPASAVALQDRRWRLALSAAGPLDALSTAVAARVEAEGSRPPQRLDATTVLRPFAAWPLGETRADLSALDLAAFAPGAPTTSLAGSAVVRTQGLGAPALALLDLSNARAGAWNDGRLPVRTLKAEVRARPDDPGSVEIASLVAELGGDRTPAGTVSGGGRWSAGAWSLDATLDGVQPSRLDARAPAMQVSGTVAAAAGAATGTVASGATNPSGAASTAGPASAARAARASSATGATATTAVATAPAGPITLKADLAGRLSDPRLPRGAPRDVSLALRGTYAADRIAVDRLEARAGAARATLEGRLDREGSQAPWRARAALALEALDPATWWPGLATGAWRATGPHRIDGRATVDLVLPRSFDLAPLALVAALRGEASMQLDQATVLAGAPLAGELRFANRDGTATARGSLEAAGNRANVDAAWEMAAAPPTGRTPRIGGTAPVASAATATASARRGSRPASSPSTALPALPALRNATLSIDAPALARLAPLARAFGLDGTRTAPAVGGALRADATVRGTWPALATEGRLLGTDLRLGADGARRVEATWRVVDAMSDASPLAARVAVDAATVGGRRVERATADLQGSVASHRLQALVDSAALPPEWIASVDLRAASAASGAALSAPATASSAAPTTAPAGASPTDTPTASRTTAAMAADATSVRSRLSVSAEGGFVAVDGQRAGGWRGTLRELTARPVGGASGDTRPWVTARDVRGSVEWAGDAIRVAVEPGRADALGAGIRWQRIAWQGAGASGTPARLDAQASIDPIPVAPLLARWQPDFGWGGTLAVGARLDVRSSPTVRVDAVVERAQGDLTVTDELGTRSLGLETLRLAVAAENGTWRFTQAVGGRTLGSATGTVTARTSPTATWPDAATPIDGTVTLRVADIGAWGTWVPAGWRIRGTLAADAAVGGRFGAPTYTGRVQGEDLGVRNFVQGVDVKDGSIAVALQGDTARIERFVVHAGSGTVSLQGNASLGEAPRAELALVADRFQVLGRVDRRIVASGRGTLSIDRQRLAVGGRFTVDEGLIDFTRGDAPTLGDDVVVIRRGARPDSAVAVATDRTAAAARANSGMPATPSAPSARAAAAPPPRVPAPALVAVPVPPAARAVVLDLGVDMGERLRVRGRGLDARLAGDLRITSPNSRLAVNGTVRAVDGTYQAYGQKLQIDRALLVFVGPVENPRLDIEATRPNLDVRVGVAVTGTALLPRIRLFSEPDMSDTDKLSWLVLGREGAGAESALVQQAALALLSGEGPGLTDRFTQAIGLDSVSVRQADGTVRDTIVSLGKQLSARWYVGYERGLNTATGSWQLVYRVARSLTVRAQAGSDNAVDLIWTLRWK